MLNAKAAKFIIRKDRKELVTKFLWSKYILLIFKLLQPSNIPESLQF